MSHFSAACENSGIEDLAGLAEENTDLLNEQLKPLMTLFQRVTRATVPIPIGGTMRNNFLTGFEEGCGTASIIGEDNVEAGLKALESASLIQTEVERRKSEILQILTGHRP